MPKLTPATFAVFQLVRHLAADSSRIVILDHCRKRMLSRRVTRRQIELCLQKGTISEGPVRNPRGNWQMNLYRHAAGEELTCTVAFESGNNRLVVITVF
jgi:hypothetical protein